MGYYMGDYYRGDPGLFGTLGGIIKKVGGAILKRSPVGAAVGTAVSLFRPQGLPAPTRPGGFTFPGGIGVHPGRILPGGKPFITREGGACPAGFHLDKRTGAYCVRNRAMNPANPRALRRAIRREKGFVALAKRVLRGTGMTIGRKGMARGKRKRR